MSTFDKMSSFIRFNLFIWEFSHKHTPLVHKLIQQFDFCTKTLSDRFITVDTKAVTRTYIYIYIHIYK